MPIIRFIEKYTVFCIAAFAALIASLASLITFSEHRILYPGHTKQYLWLFTAINAAFLIVMTVAAKLFFL